MLNEVYTHIRSAYAQIEESVSILDTGTDYEKLHVPFILELAIKSLDSCMCNIQDYQEKHPNDKTYYVRIYPDN